jgi:hypothetical protein
VQARLLGIRPDAECSYANVGKTICSHIVGKPECSFDKRLNRYNQTVVTDLLCGFHREEAHIRSNIDENVSRRKKMLQGEKLGLERVPKDISSAAAIPGPVVCLYDGTIF